MLRNLLWRSVSGMAAHSWLLVVLVVAVGTTTIATTAFVDATDLGASTSCAPEAYYQSVGKPVTGASRDILRALLTSTHAQKLPYTDAEADDVWKALQDLDKGTTTTEGGQPTVQLVYSNKEVPSEPKGTGDTWNREHVWPKSHGVGKNGHDFTDVHHLFPADWGINSVRSNRYFDFCRDNTDTDTDTSASSNCKIPTELAGADDAPRYGGQNQIFEPPSTVRGDLARALFYMALRYPHLELTDCPSQDDAGSESFEMGYLSTLLEWHGTDPPNDRERERNNKACSRWQGNRNPFVDFPELAESLYGTPLGFDDRLAYCESRNGVVEDNAATDEGGAPEDASSTIPLPLPGDVMVVGVHSDDPDEVALVTLVDLPKGLVIHLTDNAYDGEAFASNEGIVSLTLIQDLPAGTLFGYGEGLWLGNSWTNEFDKGFRLSVSGDTVVVYATLPGEETARDKMAFLSAVSFAGGAFVEACPASGGEGASCGTDTSILPPSLRNYVVRLSSRDNYVYTGPTTGTLDDLQSMLVDASENWEGSNDKTDMPDIDASIGGFAIVGLPSSGGARW